MSEARLHWFWQAAVAVFEGCQAFAGLLALTLVLVKGFFLAPTEE